MKAKTLILQVLMIGILVSSGCTTQTYEFICPSFEKIELRSWVYEGISEMTWNFEKETFILKPGDYVCCGLDRNDIENNFTNPSSEKIEINTLNDNLEGAFFARAHSGYRCVKGSEEGENENYWYCKNIELQEDTLDNEGKRIPGSTRHGTITIVYDENKNYLETVC